MQLDPKARMNLLKLVCSFAWTDLKVQRQERELVRRIARRLGLTEAEYRQVGQWLEVPPSDVDPTAIPRQHRELFLAAAEATVRVDGKVVPAERDAVALFRDLLK
jgi:tellurite resistance protein